jgi:Fe2+ or Zn2+ uptake regulation protein
VIDVDAHDIDLSTFAIGDAGFNASRADVIIRGRCSACAAA